MGVGGQGLSPVLPHGCSAAPSAALGYLDVRIVDTDYSSFAVVYIYKELEGALSTMVQLYSEGPSAACHPCQAPCPPTWPCPGLPHLPWSRPFRPCPLSCSTPPHHTPEHVLQGPAGVGVGMAGPHCTGVLAVA